MRKAILSLLLLVLAVPALGGPYQPAVVPASATWVAHLDARGLIDSQAGQWVLGKFRADPNFDAGLASVQQFFGVDLLKDIHGITLYNLGFEKDAGVAVIDTTANQQKLAELLKANPKYAETAYGEHTVLQWLDEKKDRLQYGAFYSDSRVVVGSSEQLVKTAIDVLDGKADTQVKDATLAVPSDKGAVLVAAAKGFPIDKEAALLLRDVTQVTLALGEADGRAFGRLELTTKSATHATRLKQMAQGLLALGRMIQESPEAAVLQGLGENIEVGGGETTASLSVSVPVTSLTGLLEKLQQMEEQKKAQPQ